MFHRLSHLLFLLIVASYVSALPLQSTTGSKSTLIDHDRDSTSYSNLNQGQHVPSPGTSTIPTPPLSPIAPVSKGSVSWPENLSVVHEYPAENSPTTETLPSESHNPQSENPAMGHASQGPTGSHAPSMNQKKSLKGILKEPSAEAKARELKYFNDILPSQSPTITLKMPVPKQEKKVRG
ncbi:hypothetical protein C8Q75DRAFT_812141 [Abortiporus biennis]|nr:hypothetical protein C8Q75DRAFT_812141 [Abortiporus biennis]